MWVDRSNTASMTQPLLAPHPYFSKLRWKAPFLSGDRDNLVMSGAGASRYIYYFWTKREVWRIALHSVFNSDTKGTQFVWLCLEEYCWHRYFSVLTKQKAKTQTIFVIWVNLLLCIGMMCLYSDIDYYLPCLLSMGMQLFTYTKCYKIKVKRIVTILVLIYTQTQEVWFLCNSYISAVWSLVWLFNDKTNFLQYLLITISKIIYTEIIEVVNFWAERRQGWLQRIWNSLFSRTVGSPIK